VRALFGGLPPRYWRVWAASACSNLSDGVYLVAAPLLAATLTRDPALVAGVSVAFGLPWMLFPLVSGALVDRFDRRTAMGVCNLVRAALVGVLGVSVLLGWVSLPLMYAIFFLLGANETFYDNAAQAIIPAVVRREQLEKANGRLFAAELVNNQLAGPPLGGFLFGMAAALPFLLGAGAYAFAIAAIFSLKGSFRPEKEEGAPPTTILSEIGEGLRWLYGHRLLRLLAVMLGVFNMMFSAGAAIFVLFAQDILGLGSFGFGVLMTAGAVGGLIGSFTADKVVGILGSGRALFGCALLSAASSAVIATSASPYVVGAMLALEGITVVTWNVITVSLRQAIIPGRLFGRVNSVYRLLGWGGIPLGALLGGFLARELGLTAPFWASAGVLALVAGAIFFFIGNRAIADARAAAEPERFAGRDIGS
jgi:MFS family permease